MEILVLFIRLLICFFGKIKKNSLKILIFAVMYAEIILPLPLNSTFTYEIPTEFEPEIQVGSRVLVQFGKKKYYTGIVERTHGNDPGTPSNL